MNAIKITEEELAALAVLKQTRVNVLEAAQVAGAVLRRLAGFRRWVPDVLRHTFAGYHLRHFRSYSELQYEMGHRDSNLQRTRYVSMQQVGDAGEFRA